jgi:hypothetical protein
MRALLAVTLLAAAAAAGLVTPASADCTPEFVTPSVWVGGEGNTGYGGATTTRCEDGPVTPCPLVTSTDPVSAGDGLVQVGSAAVYDCIV